MSRLPSKADMRPYRDDVAKDLKQTSRICRHVRHDPKPELSIIALPFLHKYFLNLGEGNKVWSVWLMKISVLDGYHDTLRPLRYFSSSQGTSLRFGTTNSRMSTHAARLRDTEVLVLIAGLAPRTLRDWSAVGRHCLPHLLPLPLLPL